MKNLDQRELLMLKMLLERELKRIRAKIPYCTKLAPLQRDIYFLETLIGKIIKSED